MRINFQRLSKVKACPGAHVQPMGDGVQLAMSASRQVGSLREVLAQQAIGILVRTTLLGAVRISKEDWRPWLCHLTICSRSELYLLQMPIATWDGDGLC